MLFILRLLFMIYEFIGAITILMLWASVDFKLRDFWDALECFISDLFSDKNIFGIFLSVLICIIIIPWSLPVVFSLVLYGVVKVFKFIWKLGCK